MVSEMCENLFFQPVTIAITPQTPFLFLFGIRETKFLRSLQFYGKYDPYTPLWFCI